MVLVTTNIKWTTTMMARMTITWYWLPLTKDGVHCASWSTSKGWVGGLDHRKFNIRSQRINEISLNKYIQNPFKSSYVNVFKLVL